MHDNMKIGPNELKWIIMFMSGMPSSKLVIAPVAPVQSHYILLIIIYIYIILYLYIWAIVKTLGSRKGHPQIWEGPIAYHTFVQ